MANPLAFNVGAYLPSETAAWLKTLGSSLDVFSFWIMALIAIGISATARKVSFGKALVGVMIPWGIYVLLRVGAVAMQASRS